MVYYLNTLKYSLHGLLSGHPVVFSTWFIIWTPCKVFCNDLANHISTLCCQIGKYKIFIRSFEQFSVKITKLPCQPSPSPPYKSSPTPIHSLKLAWTKFSLPQTLIFFSLYIAAQGRRPLIFQTMNSFWSNNLSLNYQIITIFVIRKLKLDSVFILKWNRITIIKTWFCLIKVSISVSLSLLCC